MRVETLLNHMEHYKGFVYEACELNRDADALEVLIRERAGTRVSCPRCGRRCTVYDHLPPRRYWSVPLRMVEGTDRTDKLHFRVSGGIRQSRITVLLSSRARAGRAGRRFRRTFFDARR